MSAHSGIQMTHLSFYLLETISLPLFLTYSRNLTCVLLPLCFYAFEWWKLFFYFYFFGMFQLYVIDYFFFKSLFLFFYCKLIATLFRLKATINKNIKIKAIIELFSLLFVCTAVDFETTDTNIFFFYVFCKCFKN